MQNRRYVQFSIFAAIVWQIVAAIHQEIGFFVLGPWPGFVAALCVIAAYRSILRPWQWLLLFLLGGILNYCSVFLAVLLFQPLWSNFTSIAVSASLGAVAWALVLRLFLFGSRLRWSRVAVVALICTASVVPLWLADQSGVEILFASHTGLWWILFSAGIMWAVRDRPAKMSLNETTASRADAGPSA